MSFDIGQIVYSRYEICRVIGRGGMSVVYLARDLKLQKNWAIKEIRRSAGGEQGRILVSSLMAEADLMKKLDHPALPRVVDLAESGDSLFVIMDYIEGESLRERLDREGPVPEAVLADWADQLCEVLGYLHRQEPPIIYRDMKPSNIMIGREGRLKLVDFGIAREYKVRHSPDTRILGTRGYAAPEQQGVGQTDCRSDIYSLGVTLYELLTGISPDRDPHLGREHPIREEFPHVSEGMARILNCCMAFSPDRRYDSCQQIRRDLVRLGKGEKAGGRIGRPVRRGLSRAAFLSFLAFLVAGTVLMAGAVYAGRRSYEALIGIPTATAYEKKIEIYLQAIELRGQDPRAYLKLLDAYEDKGRFGEEECGIFLAAYTRNLHRIPRRGEDYVRLQYRAGCFFWYLYSGGDGSFRDRALKAGPYFEEVLLAADREFEGRQAAECYAVICRFYRDYVSQAVSVREPSAADYRDLVRALGQALDNMGSYEGEDETYIRLEIYEAVLRLINLHRQGMAASGVTYRSLETILDQTERALKDMRPGQSLSVRKREELQRLLAIWRENLMRSYQTKRGKNEGD